MGCTEVIMGLQKGAPVAFVEFESSSRHCEARVVSWRCHVSAE
jgi:hypothetical protein